MGKIVFPRVMVSKTKGPIYEMRLKNFKENLRVILFRQRFVGVWNSLPEEMVESDTITTFKRHLHKCLIRQGNDDTHLMWVNGINADGHKGRHGCGCSEWPISTTL